MTSLAASFRNLRMGGEDPIHRADRAKIAAFIEQCRVDLGRGLVRETRGPQMSKYLIAFVFRPGCLRRRTRRRYLPCFRARRGCQRRTMPMHGSARDLKCRADGRRQTATRGQSHNRRRHDLPLLPDVCSSSSSKAATFFWMAMIASA